MVQIYRPSNCAGNLELLKLNFRPPEVSLQFFNIVISKSSDSLLRIFLTVMLSSIIQKSFTSQFKSTKITKNILGDHPSNNSRIWMNETLFYVTCILCLSLKKSHTNKQINQCQPNIIHTVKNQIINAQLQYFLFRLFV